MNYGLWGKSNNKFMVLKSKLENIQILRAFAAVNVVLFHIIGTSTSYGYPSKFLSFLAGWGMSGVDLFFVISGFIMVYIQGATERTPFQFFRDRIFRIVPTYWFLTIFLAVLTLIFPAIFKSIHFSKDLTIYSLLFLSHWQGYEYPLLYDGWTLELEMLFYALFSIAIFTRKLSRAISLTTLLIFIAIFGFKQNVIFIEFIYGMAIGWIYIHLKASNIKYKTIIALLCLLLGIILLLLTIPFSLPLNRLIIYGIPSAFIVFGCVNIKQIKINFLTKIGDASYSIYLIQVFTIPFFYKLVTLIHYKISGIVLAISCLLLTVFIGYIFYIIYEKRINHWLKIFKQDEKAKVSCT